MQNVCFCLKGMCFSNLSAICWFDHMTKRDQSASVINKMFFWDYCPAKTFFWDYIPTLQGVVPCDFSPGPVRASPILNELENQ